jgi:tRNA A-37 threonylcarbamoyl transferase component Bud32
MSTVKPGLDTDSVPGLRVASEALASLGAAADRHVIARAMRIALWTWPAFAALDAYMCFVAYPTAPFSRVLTYRVVVELFYVGVYRVTLGEDADAKQLFRLLSVCFALAAFTIAVMAIELGGIRSPYMHGISLAALVWAALIPTHWRRGVPTLLSIGLAFPIVMGIGAIVSPAARAQWITGDALIVFGSNYVFVVSSSVLSAILSHLVWKAQQQARKMGSYYLEERLGAGGMGEVWRARHHLLARRAAIKVIRPEGLGADTRSQQIALTRFEREAQATASLGSPHTIDLYDFGVSDAGAFFYVMELLVGRDMQSLVREFGPLPPDRVVYLLAQVCESLAEAHAAGLVHRDIKPSNIYICHVGLAFDFVKVLDFGIAKDHRPGASQNLLLTKQHHVVGTPAYMAPEAILGDTEVDHRADIYAVGCVAYYLVTGQRVFEDDSVMQMLMHHMQDAPVPPSQRTEVAVPADLDALILRCLEKDPGQRPQNAEELLRLLRACGVGPSWDRERAREWWESHLPELCRAYRAHLAQA